MSTSILDLYTIGVGPSSSHTVGPMRAAAAFAAMAAPRRPATVRVDLFGSLALTGRGHGTDRAVLAGLAGHLPESVDTDWLARLPEEVSGTGRLTLHGGVAIDFDPNRDLRFNRGKPLPYHANGMRFTAFDANGDSLLTETWYSVGGGFVVQEKEASASLSGPPFFPSAAALMEACVERGTDIAGLMWDRESRWRPAGETEARLDGVWAAMRACAERGLATSGTLPGGLRVVRRAPALHAALKRADAADALNVIDWVNAFAIAVNEENAAGGRVVTAPTNGAAGVIPAVMLYCDRFFPPGKCAWHRDFLLTAGAIGLLFKENASISGADVGCQGEVGVACSMAAAGLAAFMGATPPQVENAAEIGMEHNLGLTCDPIGGLVQIPCIERNAMGAVKAINAARLALRGDGHHTVSLDAVIATMRQTGHDMRRQYKETALGGLAVNVVVC